MANEKKVAREPSFLLALVPIVAMIGFMLYCFLGHSESGYHDAHLPLVMSIVVACIVGHFCGHDFKDMLAGMIERLSASMEAVLILCTVGFLVASFMASGAIPLPDRLRSGSADPEAVPAHRLHPLRDRRYVVRLLLDHHRHHRSCVPRHRRRVSASPPPSPPV